MESPVAIDALLQLLDDEDQEVYRHVHEKIVSLGAPVIPILEDAWTSDISPETHERIETIIREIQFSSLQAEWKEWIENGCMDLLTGYILVSKFYYPEINAAEIGKKISKLKQTIWLELNYNQTELEQIQIFNQIFYGYHQFKGEQISQHYRNYCLPELLETKHGSAIAVGILYQIIANELNLPVYGVNLYRHYILVFCKQNIFDFSDVSFLERQTMFYINPINKGILFSRNEIKDYLEKSQVEQSAEYFVAATPRAIISALLNYLLEYHENAKDSQSILDLQTLKGLLDEKNDLS